MIARTRTRTRTRSRLVGLSRLGRAAAVVVAAVIAVVVVAAMPLPHGVGLLAGAIVGTAVAALSGVTSGEPGPDAPDTDGDIDTGGDDSGD
jgi:hypothetical protein